MFWTTEKGKRKKCFVCVIRNSLRLQFTATWYRDRFRVTYNLPRWYILTRFVVLRVKSSGIIQNFEVLKNYCFYRPLLDFYSTCVSFWWDLMDTVFQVESLYRMIYSIQAILGQFSAMTMVMRRVIKRRTVAKSNTKPRRCPPSVPRVMSSDFHRLFNLGNSLLPSVCDDVVPCEEEKQCVCFSQSPCRSTHTSWSFFWHIVCLNCGHVALFEKSVLKKQRTP